jgi:fumarate reductase subunit D
MEMPPALFSAGFVAFCGATMLPQQISGAAMQRGSRFVAGCVALFMLPFIVAGVAVIVGAYNVYRRGDLVQAGMLAGFGTLFAGFAVTFLVAAIWSLRASAAQVGLRVANPDRPWLWQQQWADGVLRDGSTTRVFFLWPFAIIWSGISLPVAFLAYREIGRGYHALLIVLIFPLIGIALLISAIYTSMRRVKFGVSTLTLDRIPLQPGTTFRGELQARVRQSPELGFVFTLTSVRRVTTGTSDHRSTTETPLWQESRTISAAEAAPSPDGVRVPFTFAIPIDARSTDERNSDDQIVWRLDVAAELPGVDYASRFELPVFDTAGTATSEKVATYRVAHRAEFAHRDLPQGSQVTVEPLPSGGSTFHIDARNSASSLVSTMAFLLLWIGAIALMIRLRTPVIFPILFALFALILIFAVIDGFFGKSTVSVDRNELVLQRTWLGYTMTSRLAPADVESIATKPAGSAKKPLYDIEVKLRTKPTPRTVGCYLKDKEDAEIVAARMWNALGREE